MDWWYRLNFALNESERNVVVSKVASGELRPNIAHNPHLIALDRSFPKVSAGGNEIVVETHDSRTFVFFYAYRGVLDSYSGYLFVPEGGDPRGYSDAARGEIKPIAPHWYFITHY